MLPDDLMLKIIMQELNKLHGKVSMGVGLSIYNQKKSGKKPPHTDIIVTLFLLPPRLRVGYSMDSHVH